MKNFIVFFEEKEGTSPLMRLLNNLDQVSVVHQVDNSGWEPFDRHCCGLMPLSHLEQCFELIFDKRPLDIKHLNRIYMETATKPLDSLGEDGSVGFKMRFRPPKQSPLMLPRRPRWNRFAGNLFKKYQDKKFQGAMLEVLKRNDVVVFLSVRQDIFRWALSKYHGDGTGKPGHLQFKLASGEIRKNQLAKIHVDCDRLAEVISICEKSHASKRKLLADLSQAEIEVYPLCYENFVKDDFDFMRRICEILELEISRDELKAALGRGACFEKVHPDEIATFVENHQEVAERFGDRFVPWN